ncbi:MAG: Glucose-6-phosphate 1-dehydrogenase 2 [Chlamydiae bacterium]|nr:Glucose-6-phosphate 1-dehydrogenase 2 [Chlamydiota bacterium]
MLHSHKLNADAFRPKQIEPCIIVIFGATGDLTGRKLVPALYQLSLEKMLPEQFACMGFARRDKTKTFADEMKDHVSKYGRTQPLDENAWQTFSKNVFYHPSEFDNDEGYQTLKTKLEELDQKLGTKGNRIFYLSTQPSFFPLIIEKLKTNGLVYDLATEKEKWSRIVIEKPFGRDLQSAKDLQQEITKHLAEDQIYRIDHYLGKETVQNLMVFRFANSIFESLWNYKHIERVQITVAEDLGVGTRGRFWEEAGLLRDIVQNHMMQLLSLVAMEPPISLHASSIRDEKVKVLQSIRPISEQNMDKFVIRGQYGPGKIHGKDVIGYRQEENVDPASNIETFVALKLFIDNWRWSGVPFFLRAGKCLTEKMTEITLFFKDVPGVLFQQTPQKTEANALCIRIQPDEGISFSINCKRPGFVPQIEPVKMDFRYSEFFGTAPPEAYERLILDCILGDNTLFAREDEVLNSWRILTPVLDYWKNHPPKDFPNYQAGTWGPDIAKRMLRSCHHLSIIG